METKKTLTVENIYTKHRTQTHIYIKQKQINYEVFHGALRAVFFGEQLSIHTQTDNVSGKYYLTERKSEWDDRERGMHESERGETRNVRRCVCVIYFTKSNRECSFARTRTNARGRKGRG